MRSHVFIAEDDVHAPPQAGLHRLIPSAPGARLLRSKRRSKDLLPRTVGSLVIIAKDCIYRRSVSSTELRTQSHDPPIVVNHGAVFDDRRFVHSARDVHAVLGGVDHREVFLY